MEKLEMGCVDPVASIIISRLTCTSFVSGNNKQGTPTEQGQKYGVKE